MVNGYVQSSHKRKDKRSTDYSSNYVDRVRIDKNSSTSDNNNRFGPNRGSGWRQKSVSHSDLASLKALQQQHQNQHQHHHLRSARSLDYNNNSNNNSNSQSINYNTDNSKNNSNNKNTNNRNLHDFYSQIEPEKDYDNDYYDDNYDGENKYHQIDPFDIGNESCSLRRSRSLAVIREETFNDLQISNIKERRSQLIPRAKLVNRSFFKERFRHKYNHHHHRRGEDDSNGSGIETQTSETRESDDYYENLKRLDSVKVFTSNWQNDKSDLESLNSDYFKNSLHQKNQSDNQQQQQQEQQQQQTIPKERQFKQQRNNRNRKNCGNHYQVFDIEIHHDNSQSSAFPETTTSSSDHSDISYSNPEPSETEQNNNQHQEKSVIQETEVKCSEDLQKFSDNANLTINTINQENSELLDSEIKDENSKPKTDEKNDSIKKDNDDIEGKKSFIAYDSVYLSSEESTDETIVEHNYDDDDDTKNLENISIRNNSESVSLLEISIEDAFDENTIDLEVKEETNLKHSDNNYAVNDDFDDIQTEITQIKQEEDEDENDEEDKLSTRPKILAVEKKLKRFADYAVPSKRGVLEHLTYISTSRVLKTNDIHIIDNFRPNLIDNQYYSLPDINIGRSLKVSERIDAKLRSSYNLIEQTEDLVIESSSSGDELPNQITEIYDSINRFGRAHKRARQREYSEIDSLISSPPIESTAENINCNKSELAPISLANTKIKLIDEEKNKNVNSLDTTFEVNKKLKTDTTTTLNKNNTETNAVSSEDHQNIIPLESLVLKNANQNKTPSSSHTSLPNFQINQTTNYFPDNGQQFKIIVTDIHDNVIEEDSIESNILSDINEKTDKNNKDKINLIETSTTEQKSFNPFKISDLKNNNKETPVNKDNHKNCDNSINTSLVTSKETEKANSSEKDKELTSFPSIPNSKNNPADTENIFRARRVRIYSNDIDVNCSKRKMSRPQILHVIDSKRHDSAKQQNIQKDTKKRKNDNAEKEFLEKVDSVKCYWSKLIHEEKSTASNNQDNDEERNFVTSIEDEFPEERTNEENKKEVKNEIQPKSDLKSFSPTIEIVELEGQKQATIVKTEDTSKQEFDHVRYKVMKSHLFRNNILTRSKREAQFDGLIQYLQDYSFQELLTNNNVVIIEPVRTKIEKPQQGQPKPDTVPCKITGGSNTDSKSSATSGTSSPKRHFFYHPVRVNRELLEEELPTPDTVRNVRKFFEENVLCKHRQPSSQSKTKENNSKSTKSTITETINPVHKRRALRYLTIDTSYGNNNIGLRKWDSVSLSSGVSSGDLSSPCECNEIDSQQDDSERNHVKRRCALHNHDNYQEGRKCQQKFSKTSAQYLTRIDDNEAIQNDLSGEDKREKIYASMENICEDEMYESYYVSEDILEKIRECGSTVTYYGGRVVDNRSPELNPTTRAIIEEIKGKDKCSICQPNDCPHEDEIREKFLGKNHLGIKFKLVKSNSCSSRLELVGTDKETMTNKQDQNLSDSRQTSSSPSDIRNESEETVRELVHRLETGAINKNSVPRIIESQCIEKFPRSKSLYSDDSESQSQHSLVTINNHLIGSKSDPSEVVGVIKNITVNNHITLDSAKWDNKNSSAEKTHSIEEEKPTDSSKYQQTNINSQKVCRNKNVDLAFNLAKTGHTNEGNTANNIKNEITSHKKEHGGKGKISLSFYNDKSEIKPSMSDIEPKKITKTLRNDSAHTNGLHRIYSSNSVGNKTNEKQYRSENENHIFGHDDDDDDDKKVKNGVNKNGTGTTIADNKNEIQKENSTNKGVTCSQNTNTSTTLLKTPAKNSLVKHYVANDKKLVENRKYDEIEFEEFEVYDPVTAASKFIENTSKTNHNNNSNGNSYSNSNNSNNINNNQESMNKKKSEFNEKDPYDSLNERL